MKVVQGKAVLGLLAASPVLGLHSNSSVEFLGQSRARYGSGPLQLVLVHRDMSRFWGLFLVLVTDHTPSRREMDRHTQYQPVDKVPMFANMYSLRTHMPDTLFAPLTPGRRTLQAASAALVDPGRKIQNIDATGASRIECNQLMPCQACDPFWNLALNYLRSLARPSDLSRPASAASLASDPQSSPNQRS